jgi:ribosomal protein S18 acetylase RimI-like enzyme
MVISSRSAPTRVITIRSARADDLPVLADLIVQLYAAELPGALSGSRTGQQSLFRFTLEAQPSQALHHRYVLCDTSEQILAMGMIQFPTEPLFERAPAGTLRTAARVLGYWSAGRLLLTVARSMIGVDRQSRADTAVFHSVVVDERYRGQGLGRTMLEALEHIALEHGYRWAMLQVLASNQAARRLYLRQGYRDVWRTPRWKAALSWPSYLMQKDLNQDEGSGDV